MKKILVVGGGDYQVPLIKRIVEKGYDAYCVDRNPQAPGFACATGYRCIDVMDRDACLAYARELGIAGVMTYGATLTLPTVSYIGSQLGLPVLPMKTAEISKSKYAIKERLHQAGCNIKGDFFQMTAREQASLHSFSLPCVVKPSDGSGSKGVSVVTCPEELEEALDYAFASARYGEVYTEGFVSGEEYSVEAFVCSGQIYVYAVVKTTFCREENGDVTYGHRTPSGLPAEKEAAIAQEVTKAIRALDITMASVNFDVIMSDEDGKPYIIDCGIRIGQNLIASHMVPLSRGVSVIDNTIALALGESVDAAPKYQKCIATRLLIYQPGIIREVKPMDGVIGKDGILAVVMRKSAGDRLNPYREKSDTCGWVVAGGDTPDLAEQNAQKAKQLLKDYIIIESAEG